MAGALEGITIIELGAIGPAPFAGMMLADHGARVIRVVRAESPGGVPNIADMLRRDVLLRNREVLTLDLKDPQGHAELMALLGEADALIEGFRPGVLERLGLGPERLLAANPRLVIGRATGWGQDGPLAQSAGHDINYIALAGALHTYGRCSGKPSFPVNAIGDYAGGGMMLAFGVLAGVLSARRTGRGQVIDAAMIDGAALISAMTWSLYGHGMWRDERETNVLDGGAHFYDVYETADGKWVSLGPIEPQFYARFLELAGLEGDPAFADQLDRERWPELKARLEALFRTRTRDAWCALLDGTDACFAPVLNLSEAPDHPHNRARGTFIEVGGIVQPAPAPRFSATPAPPVRKGEL